MSGITGNKKDASGGLKSALLDKQPVLQNNEVMQQMRERMSEAQNRMAQANQKKQIISLSALNPTKTLLKAGEQSSKLSQFFNSKNIFMIYGVLDIVIFIFLLVVTIADKKGALWITLTAFYFPNIALFIGVVANDTLNMRQFYQRWLRFKLILFGFMLPLIALGMSEASWESQICSQVLQNYGIDMSAKDMQKIIDSKDFSLLLQTQTEQQQSPSNLEDSSSVLTHLTTSISRIGKRMHRNTQDLASMVEGDHFTPLTKEQRDFRFIQFCGTSVVLSSMAMIVIYQMLSGQQYFVARSRYIVILQREEYNNKFLEKLNKLSKYRMDKFSEGNSKFLLSELKEAQVALDYQIQDSVQARKMTMMTDDSAVDGGAEQTVKFSIN